MVVNAEDLTETARADSERCRDYYDGYQWTPEEIAALKKRKQPATVNNRVQRKVDAMIGLEQRGRTDPSALPRHPGAEDAADVATKALLYVDDLTRFDAIKTDVFANILIEGYGGVEIGVVSKRDSYDVTVTRLRWEEIFFDPHSRERDFSDATYMGVQKWMSLDLALETYAHEWVSRQPEGTSEDDAMQALEDMLQATLVGQLGDSYEDRPQNEQGFKWGDPRQKRIRVVQMYYRKAGTWYVAAFTGGGVILNERSPYLDEDGNPTNPMVLQSAYVDRENRRYGLVRTMLSTQDAVNKRESKLLHQLNSRQTWGLKGAVDVARMKLEKAAPDGHIEVDPTYAAELGGRLPFGDMQTMDQTAGQFQLLQEAKREIDTLGPNPSLLGQQQGQQSGRAIIAQQQAGIAELAPLYDALRDWTIRCYRQMWERIRQFWTDERWVRITGDTEAPEFLQINRVVGQQIVGMDPQTGQPIVQPIVENNVAEMDVDIDVQESPDYGLMRHEQFEQLTQMARAGVPIPPKMLIEYSSIREKRKIIEALDQAEQQAMQAQAQQAQAAMQMEQAKLQMEGAKAQASAQKDQATAAKIVAELPKVQAESEAAQAASMLRRTVMGV
jgi:hypothetical protein